MQTELVDQARHGDTRAFERLAADALDRLYATAFLILHDRGLADDAVQETLIGAWRDLPSLRDPTRFDAWLRRLLVHRCLDLGRRLRASRNDCELPDWLADDGTSIERDVADRDTVWRGLTHLRPHERGVLVLRHYLGLTVPEIAAALHVPLGTAKWRLHDAEQALRAAVDADGRLALQGSAT